MTSEPTVYVVDDESRAQRRSVEIGKRVQGGVVVLSGLSPGDRVVVNGQFSLRPNSPVKLVPAAVAEEG